MPLLRCSKKPPGMTVISKMVAPLRVSPFKAGSIKPWRSSCSDSLIRKYARPTAIKLTSGDTTLAKTMPLYSVAMADATNLAGSFQHAANFATYKLSYVHAIQVLEIIADLIGVIEDYYRHTARCD